MSSGLVVDHFGYSAGFRALAGVAALAFGLLALALPETAPPSAAAETQPG